MDNVYKCSDLALSAWLYSSNVPLLGIEKRAGQKYAFYVFEDSDRASGLIAEFLERRAHVDLAPYKDAERTLKKLATGEIQLRGGKNVGS